MEEIIILTVWGTDCNPMISMYIGEGSIEAFKNSPFYSKVDEIIEFFKAIIGEDGMSKVTISTRLRVMLPVNKNDEIVWKKEDSAE